MYIVFYDAECPFCRESASKIKARDKKGILSFSPLLGNEARAYGIKEAKELVFYDNGKHFHGGKGVLRIFWRLGGLYTIIGLLSFLPGALFAPLYRLVARHR